MNLATSGDISMHASNFVILMNRLNSSALNEFPLGPFVRPSRNALTARAGFLSSNPSSTASSSTTFNTRCQPLTVAWAYFFLALFLYFRMSLAVRVSV